MAIMLQSQLLGDKDDDVIMMEDSSDFIDAASTSHAGKQRLLRQAKQDEKEKAAKAVAKVSTSMEEGAKTDTESVDEKTDCKLTRCPLFMFTNLNSMLFRTFQDQRMLSQRNQRMITMRTWTRKRIDLSNGPTPSCGKTRQGMALSHQLPVDSPPITGTK